MFFRRKPPRNPHVKQDDGNTYRLRLKTKRHGEIIELRFTKSAHFGVSDEGGYVYRKAFVSPAHFERGEVTVHWDNRYNVTTTEIEGGELIPVQDWE